MKKDFGIFIQSADKELFINAVMKEYEKLTTLYKRTSEIDINISNRDFYINIIQSSSLDNFIADDEELFYKELNDAHLLDPIGLIAYSNSSIELDKFIEFCKKIEIKKMIQDDG
jgi:hypothetical protein